MLNFVSGKNKEKYNANLRLMVSDTMAAADKKINDQMNREYAAQQEKIAKMKESSIQKMEPTPIFDAINYVMDKYGLSYEQIRDDLDEQGKNFDGLLKEIKDLDKQGQEKKLDQMFGKDTIKMAA